MELLHTVTTGNRNGLELPLANDRVELKFPDECGHTALSWAAGNGHGAIVALLLAKDGVDVNSKDKYGRTPLSRAAENGHKAVVELLVAKYGVELNCPNKYGHTPLSWAAGNGHEAIVALLLAKDGSDVNSKDKYGHTPLSRAAENGHEATVEMLLANDRIDANPKDKYSNTPLSRAAESGHKAIVELLLVKCAVDLNSKDKYGHTPLSQAVEKGHEAIVKLLLARDGIDVNPKDKYGRTPLSQAVKNGHEAIVRQLLANNEFNPDYFREDSQTLLSWVFENRHKAIVELLIAKDQIDLNSKDKHGRTMLLWAVQNGHEAIVKLLLAKDKVNVDFKDNYSRTPLSQAVENGHEAIVKLLLARGRIDVNSKDACGRTPLSQAAGNGHEAIVKLLLAKNDVDVNPKDEYSHTPLSWAAGNGHEAIVKLLLAEDGIQLNSPDKYSRKLSSRDAGNGHKATLEPLLTKEKDAVSLNFSDSFWGQPKRKVLASWLQSSIAKEKLDSGEGPSLPTTMPTRLLDLKMQPSPISHFESQSLHSPIRLISVTSNQRHHYATLSHRWGDSGRFKTTQNTIFSYSESITFGEMPKTFRDAVIVARILGIRYLWIDALCIVQDDSEDWDHEANKMASIYGNALVNFSTHSAKNDKSGFLCDGFASASRDQYHDFKSRVARVFEEAVEQSTLSSRGWVFQERILSRRIIHFTDYGNFWEDQYGILAEDGSHIDSINIRSLRGKSGRKSDWYRLMEIYTGLKLTFEKDRLPAIAGLVAYSQNRQGNHYCAGIWSESICQGLLWRVHQEHEAIVNRDPEEIFGSWSWASHIGTAQYPSELDQLEPEAVFKAFTRYPMTLANPGGGCYANQGSLILKAFIKPMKELEWARMKQVDVPNSANSQFLSFGNVWKLYDKRMYIGRVAIDSQYLGPRSNLCCASIASWWPKYDANPKRYCRECIKDWDHTIHHTEPLGFMHRYVLILSQVKSGVFQRIGIGKFYESSWLPAFFPTSKMDEITLA